MLDSIYTNDCLAKFLFQKLPLSFIKKPLNFAFFSVFLMSFLYVLAAYFSKTMIIEGEQKGLLEDWGTWLWIIIYNPIVLAFYYWLSTYNFLRDIFESFHKSKIIEIDKNKREIEQVLKLYKSFLPTSISLLISIIYGILFYHTREKLQGWTGTAFLPRLSSTIIAIIVVYVVIMEANILIINFRGLRKIIYKKDLNINPWHPDKCGGLKPISEYVITNTYLIGMVFFMLLSSVYHFYTKNLISQFWYIVSTLPILILISALCFAWSLYTIHKKMESAKNRFLIPIAEELCDIFVITNNHILGLIQEKNQVNSLEIIQTMEQKIKIILELHSSYKSILNSFPTWPFEINSIKVWLVSIFIPIFIPIVSNIAKLAGEWAKNYFTP